MKLQMLLMLFVALIFSGCWGEKVIRVPVPCKVPESKCATSDQMRHMNDSEIVLEMKRCIEEHKENEKVCQ